MTTSTVTLVGDVSDLIGNDYDPSRTKVWVQHNTDKVVTDSGPIRLGAATKAVASDGTFSFANVVASTSLVENLQATLWVDWPNTAGPERTRRQVSFGPYDLTGLTGTVDIRTLEATQALDPVASSALLSEMQDLRDQVQDISQIAVPDDVITAIDANPASDFRQQQDARQSASYVGRVQRTANGDANELLALGPGDPVTNQNHDVYMVTISPAGQDNAAVLTSGAGAGAIGFNIGQWILRATDGAAHLTREREVANIEHDFIQLEQVGGSATFNKVVSSRFRFPIPKTGVTIVDNKGIDFVVPNTEDVTGTVENYIAVNIPALEGGGGENFYGIRFNNEPAGGSVVSRNGDLTLRALTVGTFVRFPDGLAVGGGQGDPGAVGTARLLGDIGTATASRLVFGTDGSGFKFGIAKQQGAGGAITDLVTVEDDGDLVLTQTFATLRAPNVAVTGTVSAAFAITTTGGGNIRSDAEVSAKTGFAAWGHAVPASQPGTPATLADVIAILRGCGLAA